MVIEKKCPESFTIIVKNLSYIMRLCLFVFFICVGSMISCRDYDYYTISSPDKSKCVTFEYSTSMIPNDSQFVKMYLGSPPVNKKLYAKMLWSNISGVAIDWDSSPIKVRSWLLKENTF